MKFQKKSFTPLLFLIILVNIISIHTLFGTENELLEKYEPPDGRIIHGLGQYTSFFYSDEEYAQMINQYQNAVQKVPLIYSVYTSIDPYINALDRIDFKKLLSDFNHQYILMIALSLHDSTYFTQGTLDIHVESILNGELDERLISLADEIKSLNNPVFFRPGFEFGISNSGIHVDPDLTASKFIDIWKYIYNKFKQENVTNVAWIWNTVNPDRFSYMEWYPGDEYVDWWGINYFTLSQINSADSFLDDAREHNKPVAICESCPIQNGGTTNASNWNNFFIPYFNKIKNDTNIKAFIYIHSPWTNELLFDWPDSRITSNLTISNNYKNELQDSTYIHLDEYLSNPEILTSISDQLKTVNENKFSFSNYPNPFNTHTKLRWISWANDPVVIDIYNILGKKINKMKVNNLIVGNNEIIWDAYSLPSGIYYAKIHSEKKLRAEIIKLILIR